MEVSDQLHAPAALSLGKEPPVPIGQEIVGRTHDHYLSSNVSICIVRL